MVACHVVYEWLWCCAGQPVHSFIRTHEASKFLKGAIAPAPQIETAYAVLFNRSTLNFNAMKFSIVAKGYPLPLAADCQPIIVQHCLFETILAAMVVFHFKWRPCMTKRLGEVFAETTIKIKC
jgi:hypothetical protein